MPWSRPSTVWCKSYLITKTPKYCPRYYFFTPKSGPNGEIQGSFLDAQATPIPSYRRVHGATQRNVLLQASLSRGCLLCEKTRMSAPVSVVVDVWKILCRHSTTSHHHPTMPRDDDREDRVVQQGSAKDKPSVSLDSHIRWPAEEQCDEIFRGVARGKKKSSCSSSSSSQNMK